MWIVQTPDIHIVQLYPYGSSMRIIPHKHITAVIFSVAPVAIIMWFLSEGLYDSFSPSASVGAKVAVLIFQALALILVFHTIYTCIIAPPLSYFRKKEGPVISAANKGYAVGIKEFRRRARQIGKAKMASIYPLFDPTDNPYILLDQNDMTATQALRGSIKQIAVRLKYLGDYLKFKSEFQNDDNLTDLFEGARLGLKDSLIITLNFTHGFYEKAFEQHFQIWDAIKPNEARKINEIALLGFFNSAAPDAMNYLYAKYEPPIVMSALKLFYFYWGLASDNLDPLADEILLCNDGLPQFGIGKTEVASFLNATRKNF